MLDLSYKKIVTRLISVGILSLPLTSFAAKPLDLQHQPASVLNTLISTSNKSLTDAKTGVIEIRRETDFHQTLHIRTQQIYHGYSVLGADAIVHIPHAEKNTTMQPLTALTMAKNASLSGLIYQNLDADLTSAPASVFSPENAQKAFEHVVNLSQQDGNYMIASQQENNLVVYLDKKNQAHWAYYISFQAQSTKGMPAKPSYIIDAISLTVYQQWNDVKTLDLVKGGGFGGNKKMGMISYDGLPDHLPSFTVSRDPVTKTCYLRDDDVVVRDARYDFDVVKFSCPMPVSGHNNLYWNGGAGTDPDVEEFLNPDATNGGYSPSDDAYFAAHVVKDMYRNWYHVEPITNLFTRKTMKIVMFTHSGPLTNAMWAIDHMVIYDGENDAYPLATLDVLGHEISHGFTLTHGLLIYFGQSGGLNESFSDMGAQAVEYYATGHNDWLIGATVLKAKDKALRYMNNPTQDCEAGKTPGDGCSIDHMKDYNDKIDVHHTSGIYNKVFYLMSTAQGWDVKKAFGVMIQANMYYWSAFIDFNHAACGVMSATKDYGYDTTSVAAAFSAVGIDTSSC